MASFLTRNLIQNQTQDVQFEGPVLGSKANALKPQKKGTLGGKNAGTTRKPLQDLNNRNNYEAVDIGSSKAANKSLLKNENVFKGEKVQKAKLARKPLGDLTNSKKPQLKDASTTKKNNLNGKVSALKEVTALPNDDWIAEEGFLHNHKECKAQEQTMSMEYYLELIGLRKEYTPTIAKSQPPVMSPTAPPKEIPWEYESLSDVPSPSFSPTCSPLRDWGNMEFDLELMPSPPRF